MLYVGHTPQEEEHLLRTIGVKRFEDLIASIPESMRLKKPIAIPAGESEIEVRRLFQESERRNYDPRVVPSFLGGGIYDHVIPSVVNHIQLRSEFYTAYTPYQAEVAQGTLMTIFEFQTMICELTGMEVANASMYDAGSAAAEAVLLASGATGRRRILVARSLHPHHRAILETYGRPSGLEFVDVGGEEALTPDELRDVLDGETAALLVQQPSYLGAVESLGPLADAVHDQGGLLVVSADPVPLALLEAPGKQGADVVVGEGQSLGNPPSYGGPAAGFFATTMKLVRRLPGRLVGETVDADGRRGFVLTLQTREQHIRREKATSNICTNNNLIALGFTVTLALLGPRGLRKMAEQSLQKAHYLEERLAPLPGIRRQPEGAFFREFCLRLPVPASEAIAKIYAEAGILAGIDLGRVHRDWQDRLLVAVTEKRTREELDAYVEAMRRVVS
ncbi:MAG: aminomethyl-transferring glycine dehydrogenase subunit GcvPA [Candidatus Eisenbacteria bacterium]|nr:aminomethyl-transferring glycine dehydrogenase subunit GcvPA [Candidatus Latescibacterota bacterium]MBD3301657.1 aminomethyl-transferring glycine dehydrogenase subunit GcvPA [Candidatus Eisenbacteria bacterium]